MTPGSLLVPSRRHGRDARSLLAQRASAITGRERERAGLRWLVEFDGPVVAYIHGLAGVGKATLLHAFAADARDAGIAVLEIDGHVVRAARCRLRR